jgi:streptogramin lyase
MFTMTRRPGQQRGRISWILVSLLALGIGAECADKKKAAVPATPEQKSILEYIDYSKLVWPNPPAVARIKYKSYYAGAPIPKNFGIAQKKKSSWKDRLAGAETQGQAEAKLPPQLLLPYAVAVDSKDRIYVADEKVGAIFIFSAETKETELIKSGEAGVRFGTLSGIAIDDPDRIFLADAKLHRILVLNAKHEMDASVTEGMACPVGLAIDNENRFLYVADTDLDQVLVYDVDKLKLIRKIGTTGKHHTLTEAGNFSRPIGVAVDKDGNLFVTDTLNNRVEEFDAEGNFIREFGKAGDGPGFFARAKGIAVDSDGHVWVADAVQHRIQVFSAEGALLAWMGEFGRLPGQFASPAGITIDSKNRVITTELMPGRVQVFQYITDSEADAEKARLAAIPEKKPPAKSGGVVQPTSAHEQPK